MDATLPGQRFLTQYVMNGEPIQDPLREVVWRRRLTETERIELSGQSRSGADLNLESRLTEVLGRLPDAAVPSNFTARVLQAIDRQELESAREERGYRRTWRLLFPRMAAAALVVAVAGLAIERHELNEHRAQLAQSIAAQPMPSVEALKNFNAIQRMSRPHADEQLLALLQ